MSTDILRPAALRAAAAGLAMSLTISLAAAREEKAPLEGDASGKPPTIAEKTKGLERREGFLTFYVDEHAGKIWLELPAAVEHEGLPVIYGGGLATGLGSNPVGLDRALLDETRYAIFRRVGGKVLLEQQNLAYRADSAPARERRAVRDSFATSVLWGAPIAAEAPDGRLLVEFTTFLVRDGMDVPGVLEAAGQGAFTLDADRSAVDLEAALAFPDNVEFEALLTFAGKKPGAYVRETAPSPDAVTLVRHHSLIRPPDDGYRLRDFDPRAGSYAISYLDYAAPLAAPLERKLITRHRLEKVDPGAERSRVKKPIVYYVDPGAPEPIRSALIEGASWWGKAFEAAGFTDAFRVEVLPDGANPLDVRYNMIHWVHRSTRGWSYGETMTDPRTGEILKGNVRLGSQRVRQDRLLFEGLAGTGKTGTGSPDDPVELALARIRQLAAHEVGHTLGFTHNFAASTYGRASVMDYPAPLIKVRPDGTLDFSSAYAVGVGSWDIYAVKYAYAEIPRDADERSALEKIVQDGIRRGLLFITDEDARPAGAAQPLGNLWDNGSDPVEEMENVLKVRRIALDRFGEDAVQMRRPLALLHEVLMPVYFHHRYQLDAAAKVIGGLDYAYALRGDGQPPARMIDPVRQRRALSAILRLLDPAELDLPEKTLALLLPRPFGYGPNPEMLEARTSPAFDSLGAAAAAASAVVAEILQPERDARLVDFHRRDAAQPSLGEVMRTMVDRGLAPPPPGKPRLAEISAVVRRAVVDGLVALASNAASTTLVRAEAEQALRKIRAKLAGLPSGGPEASRTLAANDALLASEIARFLDRRAAEVPGEPKPADLPPGSPIGTSIYGTDHLAGCSWEGAGE
jgi:uncharacterized protein DUF4953/uncharacterized protein DUF5117